jgi:hypothetical protein
VKNQSFATMTILLVTRSFFVEAPLPFGCGLPLIHATYADSVLGIPRRNPGGLEDGERAARAEQLITESMLIALAGGALGLLFAYLGLGSLLALAPVDLPRTSDVHLYAPVFVFTFLASLLTGVLFGLLPALHASRTGVNESLKEGADRASASRRSSRLRQLLVVGEFAISVVLLIGAGLMIATFSNLLHTDPGFDPHRLLSVQFWLIGSKYDSAAQIESFNRAVVQHLESIPAVDAGAVVAVGLPLERGANNGVHMPNSDRRYSVDYREITAGFFTAIGIPLK